MTAQQPVALVTGASSDHQLTLAATIRLAGCVSLPRSGSATVGTLTPVTCAAATTVSPASRAERLPVC